MWYVYFLQNDTQTFFYTGSTNNLQRRHNEHQTGQNKSTKHYRPLNLVGYIALPTEQQVRDLEKYFKTGSGKSILKKRILKIQKLL